MFNFDFLEKYDNPENLHEYLLWSNLNALNESGKFLLYEPSETNFLKLNTIANKLEGEIQEILMSQEEFTFSLNPFENQKKVNFAVDFPEEKLNKPSHKPKHSPFRTYLNILSALEIKNRGDELADIKDLCFDELELSVEDILAIVKKRPELTSDEYPPLTEMEILSKQELETIISKLSNN